MKKLLNMRFESTAGQPIKRSILGSPYGHVEFVALKKQIEVPDLIKKKAKTTQAQRHHPTSLLGHSTHVQAAV